MQPELFPVNSYAFKILQVFFFDVNPVNRQAIGVPIAGSKNLSASDEARYAGWKHLEGNFVCQVGRVVDELVEAGANASQNDQVQAMSVLENFI